MQKSIQVPVIPVNLKPAHSMVSVDLSDSESITGGRLKERIETSRGIPKNRQIVIILNPDSTAVEKIIHEETSLSASEVANVHILECRLGPVDILVKVRWPKMSKNSVAKQETIKLQMSPDDRVCDIIDKIESQKGVKIEDYVINFDGKELGDEGTLSYHHIVSNSMVQLIIVSQPRGFTSPGASSYVESEASYTTGGSEQDGRDPSPEPIQEGLQSASVPSMPRRGSFDSACNSYRQIHAKKMSTSMSSFDHDAHRRNRRPSLPPIIQSPADLRRQPSTNRTDPAQVQLPPIYHQAETRSNMKKSKSTDFTPLQQNKEKKRRHYSEGRDSMEEPPPNIPSSHSYHGSEPVSLALTALGQDVHERAKLDLTTVYEELYPARAKWHNIGLKMKVDTGTLDCIEKETDPTKCLFEMLKDRVAFLSWKTVVETLRANIVNEPSLADKIESQYCTESMY